MLKLPVCQVMDVLLQISTSQYVKMPYNWRKCCIRLKAHMNKCLISHGDLQWTKNILDYVKNREEIRGV